MEKSSGQKDIDRPLNAIGLQNASRMGMKLKEDGQRFDIIISSPAERALTTASLLAEQIGYDPARIHINEEVYEASVRSLLQIINHFKSDWDTILLVSYLAELVSDGEIGSMETCGLVHITFDIDDWNEVSQGVGTFDSYIHPDSLNF